jgi:hypothetical protein
MLHQLTPTRSLPAINDRGLAKDCKTVTYNILGRENLRNRNARVGLTSTAGGSRGGHEGVGWCGSKLANSLLSASIAHVKTLYLRNVPDEVVERLERLAERDKTSVSAVAVRELAEASRRVDNPALLGDLPDLTIDTGELVRDIDGDRAGR